MPGPVAIHPRVAQAFAGVPVSHRAEHFVEAYERTRARLRNLAQGMDVAMFPGAGTLANDVVAANLKAIFGERPGVVLTNGEFGERLARQAGQVGLRFTQVAAEWGAAWPLPALRDALARGAVWVWAVHLETSAGRLNDTDALLQMAQAAGCSVALDCVSSLGAVALPAGEALLLASGVSGKSLGSYAGIALAYLSRRAAELLSDKALPPSFDVLRMARTEGPVSTISSPVLDALAVALELDYGSPAAVARRYETYRRLGETVRSGLRRLGVKPLVEDAGAAPNITSFVLPDPEFVTRCLDAGYQLACGSGYLKQRGWGQIATMGDVSQEHLAHLFARLGERS